MGKVIGIDFGTSCARVAYYGGNNLFKLMDFGSGDFLPSYVSLDNDGTWYVGSYAQKRLQDSEPCSFNMLKRLLGRKYSSPVVQSEIPYLSFKLSHYPNGDVNLDCSELFGNKASAREIVNDTVVPLLAFSCEEVISKLFSHIKETANSTFNEPVSGAVITVPSFFNITQRLAILNAAKIAGLNVIRLMSDTAAAAVSYCVGCLHASMRKDIHNILIYNMGAAHFEASVVRIYQSAETESIQVLSTNGSPKLGGEDLDRRICEYMISHIFENRGVNLSNNLRALRNLKNACSEAKIKLSTEDACVFSFPYANAVSTGSLFIMEKLTRATVNSLFQDMVLNSLKICQQSLNEANIAPRSIDAVFVTGGQTKMPLVQEMLTQFFGSTPISLDNPAHVVSLGAATYGQMLNWGSSLELHDINATTLRLGAKGGYDMLIPKQTPIPSSAAVSITTTLKDQQIIGLDLIQSNTMQDSQHNTIGHITVEGVENANSGEPKFEVNFEMNENGLVKTSARNLRTGAPQPITITRASGLTDKQVAEIINNNNMRGGRGFVPRSSSSPELDNFAANTLNTSIPPSVNPDIASKMGINAQGAGYPKANVNAEASKAAMAAAAQAKAMKAYGGSSNMSPQAAAAAAAAANNAGGQSSVIGDGVTTPSAADVPKLQEEIKDLKQEIDTLKERLDVVQKNADKDIERTKLFALERFLESLLPVYDALEKALEHTYEVMDNTPSAKTMVSGVENTLDLLTKEFGNFGVKIVDPTGENFDPNFHEAIGTQSARNLGNNVVLNTVRKGCTLNGRLVRPAMVIVVKNND